MWIGENSTFPVCQITIKFPIISEMRMSELAIFNLPVDSTWLVTPVLFACNAGMGAIAARLCVKILSIEI